jgi:hypothetical protein
MVNMTLGRTNNDVKSKKLSFELVVGTREGDELSTLLFNLYMDKFIMNVKANSTGTIYNRTR